MLSIYVSPAGTGNGDFDNPCHIYQAQTIARGYLNNAHEDIEIILRGGTYLLEKPLVLTHEDSPTIGKQIIWKAYWNELPLFTSAAYAKNFTLYDTSKNIWVCDIPSDDEHFFFEHLWTADGQSLPRASSGFNNQFLEKTAEGIEISSEFGISPNQFRNIEDIIIAAQYHRYFLCESASKVSDNSFFISEKMKHSERCLPIADNIFSDIYSILKYKIKANDGIAIENAFEFLDSPGEWYFDKKTQQLFVIPLQEINQESVFIYPRLNCFINFYGSHTNPVKNIEIRGFEFKYNNARRKDFNFQSLLSKEHLNHSSKNLINMTYAENITISHCNFKNIAGNAIYLENHTANISVIFNSFINIFGSSISCSRHGLFYSFKNLLKYRSIINNDFINCYFKNNYRFNIRSNHLYHKHHLMHLDAISGMHNN